MTGTAAAGAVVLPESIDAGVVTLRCWREDDVDTLAAAVTENLEHLRPFMPWASQEPLSRTDRLTLIRNWEVQRRRAGDVVYGIWRGDRALGGTGANRVGAPDGLEIGYWLRAQEQGRGMMTHVVRELSRALLQLPGITHIEIRHDQANSRSAAIPPRCGFQLVGRELRPIAAPGETGDGLLWRLGPGPTDPDGSA